MGEVKSPYYEQLKEDVKTRYKEKIQHCGGVDPYTIKDKDLSTDRTEFPEVSLWDIGNHLVYSMSAFTKKMLKAYKSSEGYSFFESGFVLSLGSKTFEHSVLVKGKVKHSQRMNESPLQVWFLAKSDGEIICAHCTCIAGLSETCSHVAAICFAVESITKSPANGSATDKLCKWNVPKFKENSMSKVKDINWTSKSYDEPSTSTAPASSFHTYYSSLPHLSDEVVLNFLNDLHSEGQEAAVRTVIYPDEICRVSKIKDDLFLADLYSNDYKEKSRSELVEIGKSKPLQISNADLKEIARLTLPSLNSKIWVALRRGRITGSNFKDCCSTSVDDPSIVTVNRIINPVNLFSNVPCIKYQNKNKKKALKQYLKHIKLIHDELNPIEYKDSGLIINPEYPYFAVSTDGLLSCQCHGKGCVEIKCLMILESGESFDVLTHKPNNILNKIGDEYFLEKTHNYFYKTQMQIHLSESEYCHFVIWSPKETLVLPIVADVEFWDTAKQRALYLHQEVVMPELLGKFYTRQTGTRKAEANHEDYFQVIELEIEPMGLLEDCSQPNENLKP